MLKFVKNIRNFLKNILTPKEIKIYRRIYEGRYKSTLLEFCVDGITYACTKESDYPIVWKIARGSKFTQPWGIYYSLYQERGYEDITGNIIEDFRYNDYVEFFSSWKFLKVKYLGRWIKIPEHLYVNL